MRREVSSCGRLVYTYIRYSNRTWQMRSCTRISPLHYITFCLILKAAGCTVAPLHRPVQDHSPPAVARRVVCGRGRLPALGRQPSPPTYNPLRSACGAEESEREDLKSYGGI